MDRYEYKLKFDEMKTLVAEGKYESAIQIADTVNWKKVSNMGALMLAAEVYEQADRFDESIDLLLLAYDRSPIGKKVVYKLAEIAVKTGNIDSAMDYYREFVEIAPHDTDKYILALQISRARGESINSQIRILEELKEQEYTEEWSYELAYLYHKAGEVTKCVKACDELILWFGDGEYVEKALELKLMYQPLKPEQEAKYKALKEKKDGIKELAAPKQIDKSKFDTGNLQGEIVKNTLSIMNAKEPEEVDRSRTSIKKLVDDIPYLSRAVDEFKLPKKEEIYIESDKEIDDRMKVNFEELLKEESDGQIALDMPASSGGVPQITGQLNIEDIMAEWQHTKNAAEKAMAIAESEKLSAAKQRAMVEVGELVDKLANIVPEAINVDEMLVQVNNPDAVTEPEPEVIDEVPEDPEVPAGDTQELVDLGSLFKDRVNTESLEREMDQTIEEDIAEVREQASQANEQAVEETVGTDAEKDLNQRMNEHIEAWEKIKQEMSDKPNSTLIEVTEVETADEELLAELRETEPINLALENADDEEPEEARRAETEVEKKTEAGSENETTVVSNKESDTESAAEPVKDLENAQDTVSTDETAPAVETDEVPVETVVIDKAEKPTVTMDTIGIAPVREETTQLPKLDLSPEIFERNEDKPRKKKKKRTTVAQTTASLMSSAIMPFIRKFSLRGMT